MSQSDPQPAPRLLCHVTTRTAWAEAQAEEVYAPAGLDVDGFLHCCTEAQLAFVLVRHFPAATGLLVLRFDPDRVGASIDWVRSEPDQDPFPHLNGPLPLAAVLSATAPQDPQ